jgi:hypothetical protein
MTIEPLRPWQWTLKKFPCKGGFQDGNYREGAECTLLKIKSWRDAGDTPYRKNHQEEAKFWLLHTPSPCIASPLHIKWRNKESSCTTRHHFLPARGTQTTRWTKQHAVLPQTNLGQTSIAPWTDWPPPREKREKNKLNNKQQQKKTRSKEGREPRCGRGREGQSLTEL